MHMYSFDEHELFQSQLVGTWVRYSVDPEVLMLS